MLGRLSPGSYEVELRAGIYDSDLIARRKFTIIDSDIDGLLMQMERPVQLRAFVRFPTGFSPTTTYSVRVRLERDGDHLHDVSGWPITHAGEVILPRHFAPGHYRLYLFSEDPVYLKAAAIGAQDVLANGLLLDSATTGLLDLRIAKANSSIAGRVVGVSEIPGRVADAKLIAQGSSSPYVAKSVNADGAGRFLIEGVAPGSYSLVALDHIVRDTEFGANEWNQVKRWAMPIDLSETARVSVALQSEKVSYVRTSCAHALLP